MTPTVAIPADRVHGIELHRDRAGRWRCRLDVHASDLAAPVSLVVELVGTLFDLHALGYALIGLDESDARPAER